MFAPRRLWVYSPPLLASNFTSTNSFVSPTYANPLASLKTDNCQLATKMSARRHFALGIKTVAAHNITI
jgi:hypothetical protein